jgi:tRNA(Arg) A34 adenosine deaminase TadA
MAADALLTLLVAILVSALAVIAAQQWSRFHPRIMLTSEQLQRLQALAKRSLDSLDVPVGAILVYDRAIIGEGFNTVRRDHSAAGHAEINALSSAIATLGNEQFSSLDRGKLVLLSTFEPCLMCVGACIEHRIQTVYYMEGKDPAYVLGEWKAYARYLFRRRLIINHGEQVALFTLHPLYPGRIRPSFQGDASVRITSE